MANYRSLEKLKLPRLPGVHDIGSGSPVETRFTICVPDREHLTNSREPPIILILHYGGEPTPFYGRPLIEEIYLPSWRTLGAIMVAPQSFGGNWSSENNEAFAINLFKEVQCFYQCNAKKTLITGYSAGAIGCHHFALNYPELFSATIPIAGFPSHIEKLPIPAQFLLSENDELFPLAKVSEFFEKSKQHPSSKVTPVNAHSHYDISAYRGAVRDCVPWINSLWS